jgi:hypothetical protein
MSNELDRAFGALTKDAGYARLAAAQDLRKRGDHRMIAQTVMALAAAAVLVAGVAVGTGVVLAGPHRTAPLPADSSTPSPSRPVSPAAPSGSSSATSPPAVPGSSAAGRTIPKSIPAQAFLGASDVPGKTVDGPTRLGAGGQSLPNFCGADYEHDRQIGVRATQYVAFTEASAPPNSTPKAAIYEDVIVYRGSSAQAFMNDLRAAVRNCPTQTDGVGFTLRNYLRGSLGTGDDSLLIERTRPATGDAGEPTGDGTLHHTYWAVVRIGDSIAFVSNSGWESVSADKADAGFLGKRASIRLAAWRN